MPLVTIAIPTFERRVGLLRTVDAARSQTYRNLEILVSDNCSQSYDIHSELSEFAKADARLRIIRQPRNIGAGANFQFLLDWAQGAYLIWMADDDYCEPGFVEALVKAAVLDPGITLCASDVAIVDEADRILSVAKLEEIRAELPWNKVRRTFIRYPTSNIFFCIYGMFRTEALRNARAFLRPAWKELGTNNEVPFLAKMAMQGRIVAVPELLKYYRSHGDSIYTREMATTSFIDRFFVRTMIRVRLLKLIAAAALPEGERLLCIGIVILDAVRAGVKAPFRSLYVALRGLRSVPRPLRTGSSEAGKDR